MIMIYYYYNKDDIKDNNNDYNSYYYNNSKLGIMKKILCVIEKLTIRKVLRFGTFQHFFYKSLG